MMQDDLERIARSGGVDAKSESPGILLTIGTLLLAAVIAIWFWAGILPNRGDTSEVQTAKAAQGVCQFRGCQKPAVWIRSIGGSSTILCDEHLREVRSSKVQGPATVFILSIPFLMGGIAALISGVRGLIK
jgi:hypothetical protein